MADMHTPGRWRVRGDRLGGIEIDDGSPGDAGLVAVVYLRDPSSQESANARLIAAAPDLLAACRLALDHLPDNRVRDIVRAAVVRAAGGP